MLYEVTLVDGVCQVNLSNFCSNHNVRLPELADFLKVNCKYKDIVNLITKEGWNVIKHYDIALMCEELRDIYIRLVNAIKPYGDVEGQKLVTGIIGDLSYDFETLRSANMRGASVMVSSL